MTDVPPEAATPAKPPRPWTVTTAVVLQILLALFLVAQSAITLMYSADSAHAADAELEDQGFTGSDLPEGTSFEGDPVSVGVPVLIALFLIVLALFNAAGKRPARIVTWVVQPIVLICGGFAAVSSFFLASFLEAGIEAEGGPEDLDVQAVVDAALGVYPAWTDVVTYGAAVLATFGSIAIIILLAVPSANAYFRKPVQQTHIPGAPPA
ncbi:hypothetical protein K3N28_08970 [Glycomyces sp. TRM65418]|uniref:hypothetical protein n=1 Tax=Glycomyces sp. TRM65418 TaxID=2867006 RepID=UPI001CE63CB6|nr:hypothetical protein [Glycomyces sp. TRM65418]MCC3763201.1 hypothetical protein [Glycomyces sp. TRM65418]QZD57205.1 hypothetical protein K3N28_08910 [Glycomyces sp. TRM65418]